MEILKIILTSLFSVITLFVITKLMGHRQLSQLTFFDYINGITIGSIAAEMATELEEPIQPFVAMLVYGAVSIALELITCKMPRSRKFVNGSPTIIMSGGKIFRDNMKKAKLDLSEFLVLLREQGYFDLGEVAVAVFEHDGKLSVLPKSEKRPATPADLSLGVKEAHIFTELIMDGRIMGENLRRMGRDEAWLEEELKSAGYKNAREIFLAVCESEGTPVFYIGARSA